MKTVYVLLFSAISSPAMARDFCPERPGQTTPPCTVEPGHAVIETGLADWTLDQTPDSRSDTITIGASALRIGVAQHAEVAIGWTPFATQRTRDRASGLIDRQSGTGDVTIAAKRSFGDADDAKVAIKALVTLPVGQDPAGAGDWTASALIPVALPLTNAVQFALTPEIDAAVNENGDGHHVAWGSAAGLGVKLSDAATLSGDVKVMRDDDPAGATTMATVGSSIAVQAGKTLQFDAGGTFGLNSDTPDVEVYVGVAVGF